MIPPSPSINAARVLASSRIAPIPPGLPISSSRATAVAPSPLVATIALCNRSWRGTSAITRLAVSSAILVQPKFLKTLKASSVNDPGCPPPIPSISAAGPGCKNSPRRAIITGLKVSRQLIPRRCNSLPSIVLRFIKFSVS